MDSTSLLYNCSRNLSGGWKIVKPWVQKYGVTSFEGVAAETAGALTLYRTFENSCSTTHTITGIIGVGLTKEFQLCDGGYRKFVMGLGTYYSNFGITCSINYYILSIFI
jgi:PiT family inorganic phosphate transporter